MLIHSRPTLLPLLIGLILLLLLTACNGTEFTSLAPEVVDTPAAESLPATVAAEHAPVTDAETPLQETPEDEAVLVIEEIIIGLLFVATIVGVIARQIRMPYTIGLVIMGLVIALLPIVKVEVPRSLTLGLLVPPLIFEAAFHLNFNDLRRNLPPILAWAIPGVLLTMFIVAGIVNRITGITLTLALVFGALVAATDPVAVIALFSTIGVPKRLQVLLEGESLLNDGTAIVIVGLMTTVALTGEFSLLNSVIDFVRTAGGGLLVGLVLGALVSQMISRIDDHLIETTLTTVLAFGAYLIAEEIFHVSGVLAVVAAGLVNGNIGPRGMSPTTRIVVFNFWEYAGFLANSFAFLLIGIQIELTDLARNWELILAAILAILVARAIVVYGLAWIGRDIPLKWQHVLYWGGLRGAISLALALGLPASLAARTEIQLMTFGVVVFTLLVQGLSMGPLVRRFKIGVRTEAQMEYERRHARAVAVQAAYNHLENMRRKGLLSDHSWELLAPILKKHNEAMVDTVRQVLLNDPTVEAEELDNARRESLRAQRSTLSSLLKDGIISEHTYSQLVAEVDAALANPYNSWPELIRRKTDHREPIDRLMAVVIQEQDFENASNALTKLGLSVTRLPSVGGFLGRRNVTLLIGFPRGQEADTVAALNQSCRRRVEHIAAPLESAAMPLPAPVPVNVGGATIFVFDIERYEEI